MAQRDYWYEDDRERRERREREMRARMRERDRPYRFEQEYDEDEEYQLGRYDDRPRTYRYGQPYGYGYGWGDEHNLGPIGYEQRRDRDRDYRDYDRNRYRDRPREDWDRDRDRSALSRVIEKVGEFFGKGPKGYRRSDERIREDVCECLYADPYVDASEIEVDVKGSEVTLRGTVDSRWTKRRAEEVIERITGIHDVHNQLRVLPREIPITESRQPGENGRRSQTTPRT